ncbi:MAG: hypothetical protein GY757_37795 [bacterium]|nr:hypothetical protein [bacterium]
MKKFFLIIILFFLLLTSPFVFAAKLAVLPELNVPFSFCVEGELMYVSDRATTTVHLYSMKDYKRVKQLGRKGEGPREFVFPPRIAASSDYVLFSSFGKIMLYSRNGAYLKERLVPRGKGGLSPMNEGYIGFSYRNDFETKTFINEIVIFDNELNTVKTLAKKVRKSTPGRMERPAFRDFYDYEIYRGNLYIGDTKKGFFIEVFDSSGKKLYDIVKEYKKQEVSEERKAEFEKKFYESMKRNPGWNAIKNRHSIFYSDYYPAFRKLYVDSGRIYTITFKKQGGKYELIVMDLKGKEIKRCFVPAAGSKYSINNNKYYYLKENKETETWELFAKKL